MAKRTKSVEATAINIKWEQVLSTCTFEEENWSPCVAWVVGRQPEDFNHIEALNVIVQTGIRKLFSVITKEQLYLDVQELGNFKNRKVKEIPPNSEVCEPCKAYLDSHEAIPTPLLAKLIKWKMMALKDADIKRRAAEARKGQPYEEPSAADKRKGGKDAGKERVKSPKRTGKKSPEQQAKEGSKMKKRGEDEDENKYIDDEPEDGAQYYILVTGFHDPYLFQCLDSINVKVNCVIGIATQDYSILKKLHVGEEKLENEKREELRVFWRDLLPLFQQQPETCTLHDIARLDYEVSSLMVPTDSFDTEQRVNYSTALFEDMAVMIYNLLEAKRLYITYLNNMKLIHVPINEEMDFAISSRHLQSPSSSNRTTVTKGPHASVDMRYYNDLINTIPLESVSVPIIIHCMLEQVVATEHKIEPPSEQVVPEKPDGFSFELSAHFNEVTAKLGLTSEEHETLSDILNFRPPSVEKVSPPQLININDSISNRLHHLEPHYGFCPVAVERSMLQLLPLAKTFKMEQPSAGEMKKRAIRLQELLYYCVSEDLTPSAIDHVLKQFVIESMDITKCDRNGFPLQRTKEGLREPHIPWDDPYPFFRVMIPVSQKSTTEDLVSHLGTGGEQNKVSHLEISKVYNKEVSRERMSLPKDNKFGMVQRISNVIMEMVVSIDKDTCKPVPVKASSRKKLSSSSGNSTDGKSEIRRTSTEIRRGILSSPRGSSVVSNSARQSISTSVRFDVPKDSDGFAMDEEPYAKEAWSKHSLLDVPDLQQRILDHWCFAEHFKPDILLQKLQEAVYQLPFIETYLHRRDQSVMVILHNPYNKERQNSVDWHRELHSNTGFRNYLENTAESIQAWLKKKNAEYQAQLLSKEVANLHKEEEIKPKGPEKSDKKGKRSPQRSANAKTRSPRGSGSSSPEKTTSAIGNPYYRQGSLKAWQEEQSRQAAEEDEKDKHKLDRKVRSAQKLREKLEKEKEKLAKLEKSGTKSPQKDGEISPTHSLQSQVTVEKEMEKPEPYWAFYGYDTGNKLLHMQGSTSTMFPSDGGTIQTERTEILHGNVSIRSVVWKDGHSLAVHIINPRQDLNLPEDYVAELEAANKTLEEIPSCSGISSTVDSITLERIEDDKINSKLKSRNRRYAVSQFGSLTAQLSDGMILALSQFGSNGESYLQPYRPPLDIIHVTEIPSRTVLSTPPKSKTSLSKFKGIPGAENEKDMHESGTDETEGIKEKEELHPKQEFQEMFVTCPDGLSIRYFLESSVGVVPESESDRHLVVKQSYPFKTKCVQKCESARAKYIQTEISRVITANGDVIKTMVDGTAEVLSADGTVTIVQSVSTDNSNQQNHTSQSAKHIIEEPKKGKTPAKNISAKSTDRVLVEPHRGMNNSWIITYPGGERAHISKEGETAVELESLPTYFASDPETNQTMITRDDHVTIVDYPDGATVVQHSDGTRISTYYRSVAKAVELKTDGGEATSQDMAMETIIKFVKVECPAYATVEFNTATSENLTLFGNGTTINVFPDGYYMVHHSKGGRIEIDIGGTMTYFPKRNRFLEQSNPDRELQYVLNHNADIIIETVDTKGNIFSVRSTGECGASTAFEDDLLYSRMNISPAQKGNQNSVFDHHAPRFFIVHADGSGTELLRFEDVAEYLLIAEQNPAAAVLKEALPGHPGVTGITILKPYMSGISEKWLRKYDLDNIMPNGLRCRDLKTLPPFEYKKPGPKFGTNVGKGLSIGTAAKAPQKIPILKCPEKLEFRQLLQYKPVSEEIRKKLTAGLTDYANAFVARMEANSLTSIEDARSVEEKSVAHNLKCLAELQKPETRKFEPDQLKGIYEQAVAVTPTAPPSKVPAQRTEEYWRQLNKEKEEEAEAKKIIRNKIYEPYFDSELGRAFYQIRDTNQRISRSPQGKKNVGPYGVGSNSSASHIKNFPFIQNVPFSTDEQKVMPTKVPHRRVVASDTNVTKLSKQSTTSKTQTSSKGRKNLSETDRIRQTKVDSKMALPLFDRPAKAKHESSSQDSYGSLLSNIYGQPRQMDQEDIPAVIKGGKPGAHPNTKFSIIEDPVRRQVRTSLVGGASSKSLFQLSKMRGLICNPQVVDLGTLREGFMYAYTVVLTNTGIDACRFKLKQPSPSTGLKIKYTSGSIAAGMSVDLNLEMYAIALGGEDTSPFRKFTYSIQITTETDFLELPVTANILTNEDYDNIKVAPDIERKTNARRLAKRPHLSTGHALSHSMYRNSSE